MVTGAATDMSFADILVAPWLGCNSLSVTSLNPGAYYFIVIEARGLVSSEVRKHGRVTRLRGRPSRNEEVTAFTFSPVYVP